MTLLRRLGMMMGFTALLTIPIRNIHAQVTQQWVARYNDPANGDDQANALVVDASGNSYITGYSTGALWDYATIKYDVSGTALWTAIYDGPGGANDAAAAIATDDSGQVFVTGYSGGIGTNGDYATLKYSPTGQQEWVARYNGAANGDDEANSIALDSNGNVYVTGYASGIGSGHDYATIKYNSAGVQQWVAQYNGPANGDDEAHALALDDSGNVYVTGRSQSVSSGFDYATIKYNSAGAQQWAIRYNGPANSDDEAVAIAVFADSYVYIGGWSFGIGTAKDYLLLKCDLNGIQQWQARYDGPGHGNEGLYAMALGAAGDVFLTGKSLGSSTAIDVATIRYSAAGTQLWLARYNGPSNGNDWGTSIALDANTNVYVTGSSDVGGSNYDYVTLKYDSSGIQQWVATYDGPAGGQDIAWGIGLDSAGQVFVTGTSAGIGSLHDFATIMYSQTSLVEITLTPINPPIQIPASGGNFSFNATIANAGALPATLDVWIMVQLPNQSWYGPALGPINLMLPASSSLIRQRTQNIPGNAPAGSYWYEGRVGLYPSAVWDTSGFGFAKLGAEDWGLEAGAWTNAGVNFGESQESLVTHHASLITSISPNPFNPITAINYQLSADRHVRLQVFDITGQRVATLVDGWRETGSHEVTFDGSQLASGIYIYRLEAGEFEANGKMVLLK